MPRVLYLWVGPGHHDLLPVEANDGIGLPTAVRLPIPSRALDWGVDIGDQVAVGPAGIQLPTRTIRAGRLWRPERVQPLLGPLHHELIAVLSAELPPADPVDLSGGLVGSGQGLTPSGDDQICGALLAWRAVGKEGLAAALWAEVGPRLYTTSSLSASLLRCAAEGYAVPAVTRWLAAVVAGDQVVARTLTPEVVALGHSSGTELIRGALTALRAASTESREPESPAVLTKESR
jgi:hypothetical protein